MCHTVVFVAATASEQPSSGGVCCPQLPPDQVQMGELHPVNTVLQCCQQGREVRSSPKANLAGVTPRGAHPVIVLRSPYSSCPTQPALRASPG
jgi:hypothetical protein